MNAADTNVVVRLITKDDPDQTPHAEELFRTDHVFIPKTVLLESEWVLRRGYHMDRKIVLDSLERLLGLPNVYVEQPFTVYRAMRWANAGMDFADALHLSSSSEQARRNSRYSGVLRRMDSHTAQYAIAIAPYTG